MYGESDRGGASFFSYDAAWPNADPYEKGRAAIRLFHRDHRVL